MIKVLFFGPARDLTRVSVYEYSLSIDTDNASGSGATEEKTQCSVTQLVAHLVVKFPHLQPLLPSCVIARNGEYVPMETIIQEGDEIALIPPLSGG